MLYGTELLKLLLWNCSVGAEVFSECSGKEQEIRKLTLPVQN